MVCIVVGKYLDNHIVIVIASPRHHYAQCFCMMVWVVEVVRL